MSSMTDPNIVASYLRDLQDFFAFLQRRQVIEALAYVQPVNPVDEAMR